MDCLDEEEKELCKEPEVTVQEALWWKEEHLESDIQAPYLIILRKAVLAAQGHARPPRAQGQVTHPGLCSRSPITTRGDEGEKGTDL